jgi:hypothetical protein
VPSSEFARSTVAPRLAVVLFDCSDVDDFVDFVDFDDFVDFESDLEDVLLELLEESLEEEVVTWLAELLDPPLSKMLGTT